MRNYLIGEDSIYNLYITKETWEDIKLYKEEYIYVIKQRETIRIPFYHRSPQYYLRNQVVVYLKNYCTNNELTHCTLHLAVYLLDIFMDNHTIVPERLLLVANVCLLLAAKLEENNQTIPKIKELNGINCTYPINDYKALQILILQFFHWYIMIPTAAHYIHYYMQAAICKDDIKLLPQTPRGLIKEMHFIFREYLDKIIYDVHYMQCFEPSKLACAVISIARTSLGLRSWTEQLVTFSNYTENDIEETIAALKESLPLQCKDCVNKTIIY